ncbi:MAG: GNAT family N-acetyltransferase [bacterium]|nr:GNAT family N-acetyltransferase [bacterium]
MSKILPIVSRGSLLRVGWLEREYTDCVEDAPSFLNELKGEFPSLDIFTFRQSLSRQTDFKGFKKEPNYFAVIPVTSYDNWFHHQMKKTARQALKKSFKKGVTVRSTEYDEAFIQGIYEILNETPVRQGRPYGHYGKSKEVIEKEFAEDRDQCTYIGAYFEEELIGFIKLYLKDNYTVPFGMVSKIAHRDKSVQNALISHAIKVCEEKGKKYFFYGEWLEDSLGSFKRHVGCEKQLLFRYYVPLTLKGRLAVALGLHKGLRNLLPATVKKRTKDVRRKLFFNQ